MAASAVLVTGLTVTMTGAPIRLFPTGTAIPKVGTLVLVTPANAAKVMVGDITVSATRGIPVPASTVQSFSAGHGSNGGTLLLGLENLYVFGTAADTVSVNYYVIS